MPPHPSHCHSEPAGEESRSQTAPDIRLRIEAPAFCLKRGAGEPGAIRVRPTWNDHCTIQEELLSRGPVRENEILRLRAQNDRGGGASTSDSFAWPHYAEGHVVSARPAKGWPTRSLSWRGQPTVSSRVVKLRTARPPGSLVPAPNSPCQRCCYRRCRPYSRSYHHSRSCHCCWAALASILPGC